MTPIQRQIKRYIVEAINHGFNGDYRLFHRDDISEIDVVGRYTHFTIDYSGGVVTGFTNAKKEQVIFEVKRLNLLKDIILLAVNSREVKPNEWK